VKSTAKVKKKFDEIVIAEWQDTIDMMQLNIARYNREIALFANSDNAIDMRIVGSRRKMIELAEKNIKFAEEKIAKLRYGM